MKHCILMCLVMVLCGPFLAWAQEDSRPVEQPPPFEVKGKFGEESRFSKLRLFDGDEENGGLENFYEERQSEPVFPKVTYFQLEPPRDLADRIDRLVYGIKTDVPPEYDMYGYEIRRYMAVIGGPKVLVSPQNMKGQLRNIKSAQIVLKYWRDAIKKEVAAMTADIDKLGASSEERAKLRQNTSTEELFFNQAEVWLDKNRKLHEFLLKIGPERYSYEMGTIYFDEENDFKDYADLYVAREQMLMQIRGYTPFRDMVY